MRWPRCLFWLCGEVGGWACRVEEEGLGGVAGCLRIEVMSGTCVHPYCATTRGVFLQISDKNPSIEDNIAPALDSTNNVVNVKVSDVGCLADHIFARVIG